MKKPYNYLKSAEMAAEGNYNQIDGILGNAPARTADLTDGQTYDELKELAPGTLPEEKQSVLDQLAQMQELAKSQQELFPLQPGDAENREL